MSVSAYRNRDGSIGFRARIFVDGVRASLGVFATREAAEAAVVDGKANPPLRAKQKTRLKKPNRSSGFVYFARCHVADLVKVGWATDPRERIKVIDAHSPVPVVLEHSFKGSTRDEVRVHKLLAEHRVRGEWFRIEAAVLLSLVSDWETKRWEVGR